MTRQLLAAFIMLLFASCEQSTVLTESEKKVISNNVQQALKNYYDDIRKSGLMAEFNYLDQSPGFFWVPPGYSNAISYDSVATILKLNAAKYRSVDNSFDTLNVIPLSKDLATYTGRLRSIMIDTSGKVFTYSLVETGILINRKGVWKLLSGQTSILNQ